MSWQIQVDFQDGSGYRDITSLVKIHTFQKKEILWNRLKPTINTLSFELIRDTAILTLLLTEEAEPIINVTENGSAYFQGYIRPNYNLTVYSNNIGDTKIECVDNGKRLQKKIDTSFQLSNYKVCDTVTTSASIIHHLLGLAGYSAGEINVTDIDKTIDYLPVIRGEMSYFDLIEKVLFEFGYVFYHDASGDFRLYNFLPEDTSTTNILGNTETVRNIEGEIGIRKALEDYEGVDISWYNHETISNAIVFSDTSGGDANKKCNIAVPAGDFYPYADGTIEAFADYQMNGREIVTVLTPSLSVTKDADIVTNTFTNQYKRALIELENTGIVTRYITKLDIVGTAIVKGNLGIEKRRNVASTEKIFKYEMRHCSNQADAQKLSIGLARYYRYSDFIYYLRSRENFEIGDFIDIEDDYLSIDNRCVLVEKTEQIINETTKAYNYKLEGISEYTAESVTSEVNRIPPPPVEIGSTGDLIEQVPTYSEVIEGFTFGGGTKTPTQVTISECRAVGVRSILLQWDRQLDLTNFDRYEVQVSDNGSTWYSLKFDGTDWKDTVDEVTEWQSELLIHPGIPLSGTSDAPTGTTLYYRVRRVTKEPINGDYSATASATCRAVNPGELAASSVYANNIAAGVIDTILLYVDTALYVGFSGTGTTGSPDEGDRRIYIDEDEMLFQVFVNGGWSIVKSIKIGGLIAGAFAAFIGCQGIYHTENPPTSLEFLPQNQVLLYNFEGDFLDHLGNDSFDAKYLATQSTDQAKFGTYSYFCTTDNGYGYLSYGIFGSAPSVYPLGQSMTMGAWFYFTALSDTKTNVMICFSYGLTGDEIKLSIDTTTVYLDITRASGGPPNLTSISFSHGLSLNEWVYLSFMYDSENEKAYLIANNSYESADVTNGTWTSGQYWIIRLFSYRNYSVVATSDTIECYVDEFLFSPSVFASPDILMLHYLNNSAWEPEFSQADLILKPNIGGRIIFDDNQPEPSCGTLHMLSESSRPSSWVLAGGTATTFTDVDFSSYVPYGVKALYLKIYLSRNGGSVINNLYLRANGSSETDTDKIHEFAAYSSSTFVIELEAVIECDMNGIIEYTQTNPGDVYLNILGYYI